MARHTPQRAPFLPIGHFTPTRTWKTFDLQPHDDGIRTPRFQAAGRPSVFTGQTHEDLPKPIEEAALDSNNKAVTITGTGDVFMDNIDGAGLGEILKPAGWEKIRIEGPAALQRLLSPPFPVAGIANATVPFRILAAHRYPHHLRTGHLRRPTAPHLRHHRWR